MTRTYEEKSSMMGRCGRAVAAAAAALAIPMAVGGCMVDSGGALVILQNQKPEVSGSLCVVASERSMLRNALGTFDVALDKNYPYFVYPLLENRLPAGLGANTADPNRVDISSWQVKIEPPPTVTVAWNPGCPAEYDFPNPLVLYPNEAAPSIVEAMRPCHSELLRQVFREGKLASSFSERVIFRLILRAKGRHGGTEIVSDPFEFPVRVCYGCLQTGFSDPMFANFGFPTVPPCSNLRTNPYVGNACNVAQDFGPLLCCARDPEGRDVECPGVPRAPMSMP